MSSSYAKDQSTTRSHHDRRSRSPQRKENSTENLRSSGHSHRHSGHHRHSHSRSHRHRSSSRSRSPTRHGSRSRHDRVEAPQEKSVDPSPPVMPVSLPIAGVPPLVKISEVDDFHRYSTQFRIWLKQSRSLLLFDLPREQARELFVVFAKAWNAGSVPRELYRDDIAVSSITTDTARTSHSWKFQSSDAELDSLRSIGRAVGSLTNATSAGVPPGASIPGQGRQPQNAVPIGPRLPPGCG